MTDPRVEAIRLDPVIGRGTCSPVDECWTDDELQAHLDQHNIKTPKAAVEAFQIVQDVWDDRMAEGREGVGW